MVLRNALKKGMDFVFGNTEHKSVDVTTQQPIEWNGGFDAHDLLKTTPTNGPGILIDTYEPNGWINVKDASTGDVLFRYVGVTAGGKERGDIELLTPEQGVVLTSPDGTQYRVVVANDGTLSTESA